MKTIALRVVCSQVGFAVGTVVVEVLTRVHTVGNTNAGPATENIRRHGRLNTRPHNLLIVQTQHQKHLIWKLNSGPDSIGITYRKRHRNTAIKCVLVVAFVSTEVRMCAWQLGHWMFTGSGPTETRSDSGKKMHWFLKFFLTYLEETSFLMEL